MYFDTALQLGNKYHGWSEEQRALNRTEWNFRNIIKKIFSDCCIINKAIGKKKKDVPYVG